MLIVRSRLEGLDDSGGFRLVGQVSGLTLRKAREKIWTMFGLSETPKARAIGFRRVHEEDGWRLKTYEIVSGSESLDATALEARRRLTTT